MWQRKKGDFFFFFHLSTSVFVPMGWVGYFRRNTLFIFGNHFYFRKNFHPILKIEIWFLPQVYIRTDRVFFFCQNHLFRAFYIPSRFLVRHNTKAVKQS